MSCYRTAGRSPTPDHRATASRSRRSQEGAARRSHLIKLTRVQPVGAKGVLPAFMFFHGGGWILGDFLTHQLFVRDLEADSDAPAVVVNYTPSPGTRYPVVINEAYAATQ